MNAATHPRIILKRILFLLKLMGNITIKYEAGAQGIYKDKVLFCLVDKGNVYLNADIEGPYFYYKELRLPFRKVRNIDAIIRPNAKPSDIDKFLQYAIQSYWVMAGLKWIDVIV